LNKSKKINGSSSSYENMTGAS